MGIPPATMENAMTSPRDVIEALENRFWKSLVDNDAGTATELLTEPALMVSGHGAMQFDHAGYRQMAEKGPRVLTAYQLSDMQVMFPNETTAIATYHVRQEVSRRDSKEGDVQEMNDTSTWIKLDGSWKCAMHTETPASGEPRSN
jgi:ketosteroid isomerase-like protein